MDNLDGIIMGTFCTLSAVATFGGIPLMLGMTAYATSHNTQKRDEFLANEFGEGNLDRIKTEEPESNPNRKGVLLMPVELDNKKYVLELEHQKSSWFADTFYDTRLYKPTRLTDSVAVESKQ